MSNKFFISFTVAILVTLAASSSHASDARFTDNGNGTITDNETKRFWDKNANRFGPLNWNAAKAACNNLSANGTDLIDGSKKGDWMLPTKAIAKRLMVEQNEEYEPIFINVKILYWTDETRVNAVDQGGNPVNYTHTAIVRGKDLYMWSIEDRPTESNLVWCVRK
ncbi:MAG: hypothetical protein ACJAVV_000634 [Alphaproteobacteria bacterium]|jgi:hypothetical protein